MRAAQLVGERDYRMVEVETPVPDDNQVLVRITHVGICGSDSSFWKLSHTLNELHPLPAPPGSHGHEAVGRVVEVGRNVGGVRVGDQVVRIDVTYRPLRAKGITIVCPSNAALQAATGFNYWESAARLLEEGTLAPQSMIDAEYPLSGLQQALEDLELHPEWRRALVRVNA
jgi:threonine dehydrogenase-like Zn-dependent dehydrogenase